MQRKKDVEFILKGKHSINMQIYSRFEMASNETKEDQIIEENAKFLLRTIDWYLEIIVDQHHQFIYLYLRGGCHYKLEITWKLEVTSW